MYNNGEDSLMFTKPKEIHISEISWKIIQHYWDIIFRGRRCFRTQKFGIYSSNNYQFVMLLALRSLFAK
jgi:hypothetical protein